MPSYFLRNGLIALLLLASTVLQAQGDLLITPKRLVFDGTKRAEEINLANIGKDTATYTISFIQYKMNENGNFVITDENDSTQQFAHKNLRFFPRTVTLAPNEAQSVKVQLIKTSELSPGEYRSHLYFRNVINNSALGEEKQTPANESGISVNLKPVFGISIATIIRVGDGKAEATIAEPRFLASKDTAISFTIHRSGNFSLYGDIKITHISPAGKNTEVALMKGLAVYTPNTLRKVKVPLSRIQAINSKEGKFLIEYTAQTPAKSLLATAEISLN